MEPSDEQGVSALADGVRGVLCVHHICHIFAKLVVAPPRVHKEIGHGAQLEAQLLGDSGLHLFRWTFGFLEDGVEGSALDVREHKAGLLRRALPGFHDFSFFLLTSYKE